MHWLYGSIFQCHMKLSAADVVGILQAFGAAKPVDIASMDTVLHRNTVGVLYDRLRMAIAMVVETKREQIVFFTSRSKLLSR